MTRNVGPEDRVVRIVIAIILAVPVFLQMLTGAAAVVACLIAAYLLITGLVSRCLVYKVAGIDTSVQEQPYSTTDDRAGL